MGGDQIVTFVAGGSIVECAQYTVVGDDLPEMVENFSVSVVSQNPSVIVSPSSATVVVVDDDLGIYASHIALNSSCFYAFSSIEPST